MVLLLSVGEFFIAIRGTPSKPAPDAPLAASIAVLPFVNMSGDPGREIFSDGISEELLNELSNIAALRVRRPHVLVRVQGKKSRHHGRSPTC